MSKFSGHRAFILAAVFIFHLAAFSQRARAILPRPVLKEFFQSGDKPTASQFATFIDSTINFVDDRKLLGLKVYDPQLVYLPGDTTVFNRLAPGDIVGADDLTSSSTGVLEFGGLTVRDFNDPIHVDVAQHFAGAYGFLGIKLLNTATGEINYGYIQMGMESSGSPPAISVEYIVYNEIANQPIEVVAVPEPASVATFAFGTILMIRRRAKK